MQDVYKGDPMREEERRCWRRREGGWKVDETMLTVRSRDQAPDLVPHPLTAPYLNGMNNAPDA